MDDTFKASMHMPQVIHTKVSPFSLLRSQSKKTRTRARTGRRYCLRFVTVGLHRVSALSANAKDFTQNEWEVIGSRNVTKRELVEVVQLVGTGRVRPIVTGVFPLTEAEVIHARLRKQEFVGRVVLEP